MKLDIQFFGGRGSSSSNATRGGLSVKRVITSSGNEVKLTNPLVYGKDDPNLTGQRRQIIEEFEKRRANAKIEYGLTLDANGNVVTENKGGRGSVRFTQAQLAQSKDLTHIHPRGKGQEGLIGGTFSDADLQLFNKQNNLSTMRAKAAEGTYSISKTKNFNSSGFTKYMNEQRKINTDKQRMTQKKLAEQYFKDRDYKKYSQGLDTAFNDFLVDQHNSLRNGAKTYGYDYTLERKK